MRKVPSISDASPSVTVEIQFTATLKVDAETSASVPQSPSKLNLPQPRGHVAETSASVPQSRSKLNLPQPCGHVAETSARVPQSPSKLNLPQPRGHDAETSARVPQSPSKLNLPHFDGDASVTVGPFRIVTAMSVLFLPTFSIINPPNLKRDYYKEVVLAESQSTRG